MARFSILILAASLTCLTFACDDTSTDPTDTTTADTSNADVTSTDTAQDATATTDTVADIDTGTLSTFAGSWRGTFTVSVAPGTTYWIELALTVDGTQLTGTMTTENGRAGTITGVVSGSTATYELVYTDACTGTATGTVTLVDADTLTGTIDTTDCNGPYTGLFSTTRM